MHASETIQRPRALAFAVRLADRLSSPYAGWLRALAVRAMSGREYSVETAWGVHVSPATDHTFLHSGFNEPTETRLLAEITQPGMTFLDIGANRGWFTLMASCRVGEHGRVIALEPDPRARSRLQRTLEANGNPDNVTVIAKAAGRQAGTAPFVLTVESALAHLHHSGVDVEATVDVEVDTVDKLLLEAGVNRVDVVKIDIEGAEVEALSGMTHTLAESRPILLVEVERHLMLQYGAEPAEVLQILGDDYHCRWVCWHHDRTEPWDAHCASGRNLLCQPVSTR